ncbi:magnesium transporter CorA family protein [Methylobacterium iners]|uniref:Magnesium transport protein CorA n=1 Tax=Methylobacterium iners TaxID=418707 RepID=A0ABQ4RWJ1_9HYPH|nr:magnesium transporter CorA family protein [Methylobacterium iners]GJD94951.1 Magnesium transport protein CorA [Methylobacterium iners]
MMDFYALRDDRLLRNATHSDKVGEPSGGATVLASADDALWIDLVDPTTEEEKGVERLLGLQVPTRQEMAEIEDSARLYEENGALVMTAVVITGIAEGRPARAPVTFVLTPTHLVSVRYADPVPFRTFEAKCQRQPGQQTTGDRVLTSLLESIIERAADVLESVQAGLNDVSTRLFIDGAGVPGKAPPVADDLQNTIRLLGRQNLTLAILRVSLLSLVRLVPYVKQGAATWLADGGPARLKQLDRDLRSLTAYETQLSAEIAFLHEATIGLINLEQNRIIKVFSIAAVLFLPPTLVGTVYGMNFEKMPELKWEYGYPLAIFLMVLSSIAPYYYFKMKRWL